VSIPVTCNSCNSHFNAPDDAGGKRTKCPTCGGIITIPARAAVASGVGAAAAAFASEPATMPAQAGPAAVGEDRKQCPMCGEMIAAKAIRCRFCGEVLDPTMKGIVNMPGDVSEPGWKTVRSGLKTLYYSLATIFGAIVLAIVGGIILAALEGGRNFGPGGGNPPIGLMILFVLLGLTVLGAGLGALIGQIMCANVPASSGARGFAIGSAICLVGYVLASMIGGAIQNPAVRGIGGLMMMIGSVLFILFIRRSATYLNNPQLASSAGWYLVFSIALFVGTIVLMMIAVATDAMAMMAVVGLILIVCGLISIIWYLRLIRYLIATIEQSLGTR